MIQVWCPSATGKNKGSVSESPLVPIFLPLVVPLPLRSLGVMTLFPIIRLTPMVCQSVQEGHTHYPRCPTSPSTQKPCFHLVIWDRQAHQTGRQQWDMDVPPPLSADIHVLYRLDYTGGFRVHGWQRRCSWGHIRHISFSSFCQQHTTAGRIWYTVVTMTNREAFTIIDFLIE